MTSLPQQSSYVDPSYPVKPINPEFLQTPTYNDVEQSQSKKKSKKKRRYEEEVSEDPTSKCILCCGMTLRSWIIFVMWFGAAGLFGWYFANVYLTLRASLAEATTSIILEPSETGTRGFPAVTVCNWNTMGPPPNNGNNCSFCEIEFVNCYQADDNCSAPVFASVVPKTIGSPEGAIFNCYTFNGDYRSILQISEAGYDGSVSLVFDLVKPYSFTEGARLGIQVTFHSQNITEPFVWNETNYVRAFTEGSYSVVEVKTIVDEVTLPKITYEAKASAIGLAGVDLASVPSDRARVIVSFSYETLSQKVVRYVYTYTISSFLGDLAGMAGLLMGLDSLKVVRGFLALTKCRQKGLTPFARVFNS